MYFRKALETGNMSGAAKELHVAQTALGIQIRNLEEELGVALLERHSRGVRATPSGELLRLHAEEILAKVDEAKRAVRTMAAGRNSTVRLGVTPSIVRLVGDEIVTQLGDMLPGTNLHLIEDFSFVLMRQLQQGELNCALTFALDIDSRFSRRALLEEDLFFFAAKTEGGEEGPITFREVISHELALTGTQDVVTRTLGAICERLGMTLNVAYEVQSIRAVKNLVSKGAAAAVMPWGAAEGEITKGEFVARRIISPAVVRTLAFVAPQDRALTGIGPDFDAFIDAIADRLCSAEGPITRKLA
nr:LysR family transcriptional regulator [Puniceibacterium sp. IMCC21224]